MSVEAPPPSSSFNDRSHWLCRWNWCNSSFITQTQLAHHINEAHIQTMKSVKRHDLKAILQEEPGSPSAPSLSPLERLANQATLSQSTTNSSQPPDKTKPVTDTSDSTRSDALARPAEVPIQPQVPSTSLEPPSPPAPVGFRRFRTIGGLRGETPSPAPLPPSPDVSELIFHAAGTRNPLPPQPPASPSPSKKRPRSPTTRASISMSRSPSPTRSRRSPFPDRSVISPAPGANSTQSTNLTPFAKRLKVSRQTPPPPAAAAALLSRSKSRTPSPQRRAAVSTPSPAVSQAPRDPSSSPVARSAPPTTPSPASLPSEPGSSPFPEEDEDEKDDGPGTDSKPSGERAATGDLDELEEFYGTKESGGGTQDVGDDEGEQSRSQSLNVKDPFGFQTQAFPESTLGDDSY